MLYKFINEVPVFLMITIKAFYPNILKCCAINKFLDN
jgi:hypothetical protein